jgi:U3 small nucleolar ribonucleoprotein protein IMP3
MEGQILSKLYDMGVLNSQAKLSDVDNKLTVAAFCRRRLAVIMVTSKMAETVSAVSTVFLVDGMCQAHSESGGQIY